MLKNNKACVKIKALSRVDLTTGAQIQLSLSLLKKEYGEVYIPDNSLSCILNSDETSPIFNDSKSERGGYPVYGTYVIKDS